ncbi:hypothetical protein QTJ16_001592 [Diplocarpon rosae]|uniref:C2H2-type domain-containing protein n=1 Tax=Diplocarpon rosae TaxID=946125 RepID=A0AAD9WGQ9_9HELO|nr:hypothetical protein QTJ16_001592 [Diplocarpon rosae]PBP15629.1 hypothetical protein BUE80_DR013637 [Diplocarpon rosae]
MSLVSQHLSTHNNSLLASNEVTDTDTNNLFTEAALSRLLGVSADPSSQSMDRGASEYSQSGLQSPSHALKDSPSEETSADHASAAHYAPQPEARTSSHSHSSSATPTSEYGIYPASARSSSFPGHVQRQYHPSSNGGGMAQPTSPSLPLQDGRSTHHNTQSKSDQDVPIDPSIAASSPTYPTHNGQYSPYPPQQDMQHGYPNHQAPGAMYSQPRPDWAGYAGGQHPMHGGYPVSGAQTPTSAAPSGGRPGQVYSFVPIPGAQQHKRPRRRYEEIERMYKCGWNGCEKAYGTLNHLNAHVTMQSHGQKRTPEEFKEIRKEWKARKKEEETQRKAEDDRARAAVVPADGQAPSDNAAPAGYQQPGRSVQLPPIGYQPGAQVPGQYQAAPPAGVQQLQDYPNSHLQYSGYPASPYGAPNQMYNQHNAGSTPKYEQH